MTIETKSSSLSKIELQGLYNDELDSVFRSLDCTTKGLVKSQVDSRQHEYGLNKIETIKRAPPVRAFLANFTHTMALLLWCGGTLALIAGMRQLAIAIWLVNVINGLFSFWQEFKAEKATEALLRLVPKQARVLRDGKESAIAAADLVPGDIICVEEGDEIPADARLFQDDGLYVDQSLLTGESAPVRKQNTSGSRYHHPNRGHADVLYAGTSVTAGRARAVVIATGMSSRFGKIAHLTQAIKVDQSPLQKEMSSVTKTVTTLAVAIGLAFYVIAVLILDVNATDSFVFALGMIVAFVPEGMLPTVSLSLAIAVQQMADRKAIVRRLSSVETLGCTTVICSDKTGTLTRNEMMVTDVWCPDQSVSLSGCGYEPAGLMRTADGTIVRQSVPPSIVRILSAAARCCNATLIKPSAEDRRWTITGDPTEAAIVVAYQKLSSVNLEACDEIHADETDLPAKRVDCISFDPHRKRMSTVWQIGDTYTSYVKGAPKEILALSENVFVGENLVAIDSAMRIEIKSQIDLYAQKGLRVLAVATKSFDVKPASKEEVLETNLTFLGLVAMMDPLHEEVPDALFRCHEAGIRVIMITGDYEITAESIAREAGIISSRNARVLTGEQLAVISESELKEILQGEVIFARTSPEDKLRIVKVLQESGDIVAVTGDGINDGPALKQADIGIAMGRNGTDVARESADMVLSDDNFASIVSAVELGRSVYDNIRKFAAYVFTSNVAEAVPFALLLFSRGAIPLPITLMQVLLIDLGTDMLPAIGLGADPPNPDVMRKPPRKRTERLLSKVLLMKVFLWYGLIEALACISAYFFVNWQNGWPERNLAASGSPTYAVATTACVAAVVACQAGVVLCCRSEKTSIFKLPLFDNKLLIAGIIFEIMLVGAVTVVPQLKAVFNTEVLTWPAMFFVAIWFPIVIVLDEIRKLYLRRTPPKQRTGV